MSKNLILIPGLLCNHDLWRAQISAFEEDFELMVVDHTTHDNLPDMAADFLRDAPETFHLAGLSMGGYLAFEIIRQASARVESLMLLDTNARADRPAQVEGREELIRRVEVEDIQDIARELTPHLIHPDRLNDAELCARILDMAADVGAAGFQRQQRALINRPDSRADLPGITCPTLIICGMQDALTPPKVHQEMADLIPGAQLHQIDHCGHLSSMEQPGKVTTLMRKFL